MHDLAVDTGAALGARIQGSLAATARDDAMFAKISTRFALTYSERGVVKWRAHTKNRVVTAGLNRILNAALVTGNVVTPTTNETFGSGNGSTTGFSHTLGGIASSSGLSPKVIPGSFSVTVSSVTGTDNGAGGITGAGIAAGSTINYATGACVVNFSAAPGVGTNNITCGYSVFAVPAFYVGICGPSVADGAMSSGSPNLACHTSTPFQSQDVGRVIIVRGAGAAGGDLVTTILTYTDSGDVVLAANASTNVSGANVIFDARAADTMGSHSPWSENTAYTQATRPQWTPGTPANGSVDNSSQNGGAGVQFSINANNQQIGGIFLSDSDVIGGTTGLLYGMAPFGAPGFQQMNTNGMLDVIVTATAASA